MIGGAAFSQILQIFADRPEAQAKLNGKVSPWGCHDQTFPAFTLATRIPANFEFTISKEVHPILPTLLSSYNVPQLNHSTATFLTVDHGGHSRANPPTVPCEFVCSATSSAPK